MLHLIIFREICVSSENHCSLFGYLQWSILNIQAGKSYRKNNNIDIENVLSATFVYHFSLRILWHSWLWQLCKNLCSRCAQRCVDLNVRPFLTDFNQCWNVPLNFGTPPQYKIWQKSVRSWVLSCAWTDRGFSEQVAYKAAKTPINWQNNDFFAMSI